MLDMFTDSDFLSGTYKTIRYMLQQDMNVYQYVLSYEGSQSFKDIFPGKEVKDREIKPTHADDLIYLFDSPRFPLATEEERNLSSMSSLFLSPSSIPRLQI